MKKTLSLLLIVSALATFAQEKTSKQVIKNFSELFATNPSQAYDYLVRTNASYYENNSKEIEDYKKEILKVLAPLGNYQGKPFEIIYKQKISKQLHKYQVVFYYQKMGYLTEVYLYNAAGGWQYYNFKSGTFYGDKNLIKESTNVNLHDVPHDGKMHDHGDGKPHEH